MSNDLITTVQDGALGLLHGGIPDMPLNPFEKEIFLKQFVVDGTIYKESVRGLAMRLYEGADIKFIREKERNKDPWYIRVEGGGATLGRVPASMTEIPAHLMDAGKNIYGKVSKCKVEFSGAVITVDMYMKG